MTDLRGKHVIVTGGSEGIGAAAARQAASSGARVSLVARRESTLRSTAQSIGAAVEWASCDVGDAAATHHALEHLERRQGPCDVLVACAGIVLPGRFLEVPLEEFDEHWRVNVRGSITAARAVLPGMVERGAGHLVFVSSTAGLIGVPGYTGYGATKYAIRGLADSLRYEVEPSGVHVTVLYPPDTDTPGFAAENLRKPPETAAISGRISPVQPDVVAAALLRGIVRNRRAVTVDGATRAFLRLGAVLDAPVSWSFRRTVRKIRDQG